MGDDGRNVGFQKEVPLARVQLLTDFLFASAMMFMLLGFDLPDPEVITTDQQIFEFLKKQLPAIEVYAITFLLIAIYWVKHLEHFSFIEQIDYRLLWLQLLFLLFLVILPIANTYSVLYVDSRAVHVCYCVILIGMGLFSYASWRYASTDHRLIKSATPATIIRDLRIDALVEPAAALISLFVCLVHLQIGQLLLLGVPIIFGWQRRKIVSRHRD